MEAMATLISLATRAKSRKKERPLSPNPPSGCGCSNSHWCLEALRLRQEALLADRAWGRGESLSDVEMSAHATYREHRRAAHASW